MSIQVSLPSEMTLTASEKRSAYLANLLKLAQSSPANLPWLNELRDHAALRVQEQAFPTQRDEEWRFTDLSTLLQTPLEAVTPQQVSAAAIAPFVLPEASQLVFVDGIYAPELSNTANLPETLRVGNLAALERYSDRLQPYLGKQPGAEEVFTALNTAGLTDAAVVWVPKGVAIDTPIHLLFLATATSATLIQPRVLVVAETNSAVTLIEDYGAIGTGAYLTNAVTEIWIADNAEVNHTRVQRDGHHAFHIGKTAVSQARTSRYTCNAVSLGAKLSRHHLEIYQTGAQTETTLNGLTLLHGEQIGDTHSTIALTQPHGTTRQLHKCIVDDKGHAVFNGKVFVPQAAQMTDAGQLNRNLLLSPKARIDTKPQLEIVADNVKCTHGATVGQLEADEVFYLQSRGIDAADARQLLVYAFAYEVIEKIAIASLRRTLSDLVQCRSMAVRN
ncbi:MAG: Fe-S cluster assembly protein SufD [Drouetiella hepatica Uher 2000/2452]|jgi:Fe-S cluster assembly protein SufD|uniref:Fe-S cluster assembly protein SufD n=1 Tax=Drouetiella hepatica Uher 2000/2452 TaxID=904376 RepID=A0A951QE45_9CYAN|nr:Fe-S cluster assembly protein SufD [Drouetiella hepatica Uher 2000/2452]